MRQRSQVTPITVWTVGLNLLLLSGIVYVFQDTWFVITWLLVALIIALAIEPPVRALERIHVKRGWAVLLMVLLMLGFLALLFTRLVPLLVLQARALIREIPELLGALREHAWMQWADSRFHVIARVNELLQDRAEGAVTPVLSVVVKAVSSVVAGVTVLSLVVFMSLFGSAVWRSTLDWFPPERRAHLDHLGDEIRDTVGGYVIGTVFISFLGGAVVAGTMLVLGVPYFLPIGLAVAVLGLLPFIGAFLGEVMLFMTAFVAKDLKTAVIALGVYMIYLQLKNKLVVPVVQRHTIRMNPLLIAIVLLVGTALFGLIGTIISLPIAGAVQVVLRDLKQHRHEAWRARDRRLHAFHRAAEQARAERDIPEQLELLPPEPSEEGPSLRH